MRANIPEGVRYRGRTGTAATIVREGHHSVAATAGLEDFALRTDIELEARGDGAELAQGAGLQLAHPLARDAEAAPDLF